MSPGAERAALRAALTLLLTSAAVPTNPATAALLPVAQEWCEELTPRGNEHCEVRELATDTRSGQFTIDARPNGSIRVDGWDGSEVRIEARLVARSQNVAAARALADRVEVRARAGEVGTSGPRTRGRDSWTVSYRVLVPRGTDLTLEATNGGVTVAGVGGAVEARSTNGGIQIEGAAGPVRVRSTNGGIRASLTSGTALDQDMELHTTNGPVTLTLPAGVSARLNASTSNGGISSDIPLTIQGQSRRQLRGVMGQGGPEIRVSTTNGPIRIRAG